MAPTPAVLPGKPMDRGAPRATVDGIAKESDMTQQQNNSNGKKAKSKSENFSCIRLFNQTVILKCIYFGKCICEPPMITVGFRVIEKNIDKGYFLEFL